MKLLVSAVQAHEQAVLNAFSSHGINLRCQDGAAVTLKQVSEAGYTVCREAHGYSLCYHLLPDLCRGLLLLAGGSEAVIGETLHEESPFQDLGIMLDTSRNAVPKVSTVKDMIFYAACLGYRYVALYMEDTIAVEGEPYFGYMRGRLTRNEIREMDAYAASLGIELRPCIQTLAHLNQITRYERYQNITDTADILLVGDARTEQLLDHLLASVKAAFSTSNINLGMDEAWLLGAGKYYEQNGHQPKSAIMVRQLGIVMKLCQKYGLRPQMWSDMFFHAYERGEQFQVPDGLEIVYWDYYSTETAHYAENLKKHKEMSSQVGFAGGAWKWTGFVPHNRYSIETGKAAITACKQCGIGSYLLATFGDDGAEASVYSVLPALYQNAIEIYSSRMEPEAFALLTGVTLEDFLDMDLVNPYLENPEIHNNCSKYLLYNDPLIGTFDSVVKADTVQRFRDSGQRMRALSGKGPLGHLFETMACLSQVLSKKADLGIRIRAAYTSGDEAALKHLAQAEIPELIQDVRHLYKVFEAQWKAESKSFGFEVQTIRFGALLQRLADVAEQLLAYTEGRLERIEELEEPLLPFVYFEKNGIEELNYNLWSDTVSPSVIG